MDNVTLAAIASVCFYLLGFIIGLIILWAIIRGAVLSALRKHSRELAEQRFENSLV